MSTYPVVKWHENDDDMETSEKKEAKVFHQKNKENREHTLDCGREIYEYCAYWIKSKNNFNEQHFHHFSNNFFAIRTNNIVITISSHFNSNCNRKKQFSLFSLKWYTIFELARRKFYHYTDEEAYCMLFILKILQPVFRLGSRIEIQRRE